MMSRAFIKTTNTKCIGHRQRHSFCNKTYCFDMEAHERLRTSREKSGFPSAQQAAERHGWPIGTYRSHENGQRGFPVETAKKYARAFGVSVQWLITGEGHAKRETISVRGYVGAGAEIRPFNDGGDSESHYDEVASIPGISGEQLALRIRGDSQFPAYRDGEVIVVGDYLPLERASGAECIIETEDGRVLLKTLWMRDGGLATLESFNAPPEHDVVVRTARPIVAILKK